MHYQIVATRPTIYGRCVFGRNMHRNNSSHSNLLPIHPLYSTKKRISLYINENDKKLENKILNHQDKVLNNTNNIFKKIVSNLKNKKKASFKFILF